MSGTMDCRANRRTDDPLATLFESRPVFESALSAGCIEMMTGWMKRCKVEHKSCPRQIEQPLPTRVIDVEPSNGKVRLFVSNGRSGQWAALSHCWGEVQPVKTIKTNFDIHCQKGLDLASLTPTFRNAIILTRRLGIPYIWINSLCIIQNNSAD
ncbi:HET-domain-containing protein [Mollisia scopiformis]|uniref:HET-domain-containing protein n=1 Tax=Mollisia scopiformis TaxID=149040 RepID=A0A194XMZ1_MOLSC|nr:HET-domain-containing protein [Mollisia scopiformis]KUJ21454.1 HET-domain-containing protein [Mollisia scopiformis]